MYEYRATVLRVVDGDTIDCRADLGFDVGMDMRLRLAGIDAPEMSTEAGKAASRWLADKLHAGTEIIIKTQKDRREKFGRYLAEVFLPGDAISVNQAMVDAGMAKRYDGGKR
jgi:micrococcal nuclease